MARTETGNDMIGGHVYWATLLGNGP